MSFGSWFPRIQSKAVYRSRAETTCWKSVAEQICIVQGIQEAEQGKTKLKSKRSGRNYSP